jgi:hypothetical protein
MLKKTPTWAQVADVLLTELLRSARTLGWGDGAGAKKRRQICINEGHLDILLEHEIREEENLWLQINNDLDEVRDQLVDMIFNDLVGELANDMVNIDADKELNEQNLNLYGEPDRELDSGKSTCGGTPSDYGLGAHFPREFSGISSRNNGTLGYGNGSSSSSSAYNNIVGNQPTGSPNANSNNRAGFTPSPPPDTRDAGYTPSPGPSPISPVSGERGANSMPNANWTPPVADSAGGKGG